MTVNYRDKVTALAAAGHWSHKLPANIRVKAINLLRILDAARNLEELRAVPGNRFHALKDERKGQYSIAINMQWRICFGWSDAGATDVEIVDYH